MAELTACARGGIGIGNHRRDPLGAACPAKERWPEAHPPSKQQGNGGDRVWYHEGRRELRRG
jgi:hypothetical protein